MIEINHNMPFTEHNCMLLYIIAYFEQLLVFAFDFVKKKMREIDRDESGDSETKSSSSVVSLPAYSAIVSYMFQQVTAHTRSSLDTCTHTAPKIFIRLAFVFRLVYRHTLFLYRIDLDLVPSGNFA